MDREEGAKGMLSGWSRWKAQTLDNPSVRCHQGMSRDILDRATSPLRKLPSKAMKPRPELLELQHVLLQKPLLICTQFHTYAPQLHVETIRDAIVCFPLRVPVHELEILRQGIGREAQRTAAQARHCQSRKE